MEFSLSSLRPLQALAAAWALAALAATAVQAAPPAACSGAKAALGVARTVEIDTSAGPIFGALTSRVHEPSFLNPKEVVLTFDDGPMPWVTRSILDTLDAHCTKATFFAVGRMALAYPGTVRDVLARGHTLGSHTMTHPYNMPRMPLPKAEDEIERGFAALTAAAGDPVAPFFRFTGLADSNKLLGYLQTRGIASFTVDVVSNDSYISDRQKLVDFTLSEIEKTKGGIVLFHDIKPTTAKALPEILAALKARGYSVVHVTAKAPVTPQPALVAELTPKVAKAGLVKPMLPFYGAVGPERAAPADAPIVVTALAPSVRDRTAAAPVRAAVSAGKPAAKTAAAKSGSAARVLGWSAKTKPALYEGEGSWAPQVSAKTAPR